MCFLLWMFYKYILKKQLYKNASSERISLHGEEIQVQVYCVGAKLNWLTRLHKHKMRFAKFLVQCPPTLLLPTKAILSCSQKCDQKLSELAFSFFFIFQEVLSYSLQLRVEFEEKNENAFTYFTITMLLQKGFLKKLQHNRQRGRTKFLWRFICFGNN